MTSRLTTGSANVSASNPTVARREFLKASTIGIVSATFGGMVRSENDVAQPSHDLTSVKALVFDTFGTVVDWRSSIAAEVEALAKRKGFTVDAAKFADAWRAGYGPSMNRVRKGELPWTKLDDLHRMTLDKILTDFDIKQLTESEKSDLNHAWHRLRPWPDAVAGLTRLKKKFIIAPLSNGNIALMTDLAKYSALPWDCILGAELVRHYKPDREVYQSAADFLNLQTSDVVMVAAHLGDLRAAKTVGLKTAFVTRPAEYGSNGRADLEPDSSVDVSAKDFNDLAGQFGT
ncbi:MAG TPA: haloacid dehalogenase type II [Vicinamibacterales bacterium]|jgi:2-haloacid dehalogenase|nr:haloacid dehalogenase type II [Vicinamibacterales bacterium]